MRLTWLYTSASTTRIMRCWKRHCQVPQRIPPLVLNLFQDPFQRPRTRSAWRLWQPPLAWTLNTATRFQGTADYLKGGCCCNVQGRPSLWILQHTQFRQHLLRNLGQSAYIAISFLVVLRTSQMNYADMVEVVSPFNELWGYDGLTGAWSTDSVRGLKALSGEIGRQSQMIAFNNAFLMYGLTCVAAMPLVLLWRKTRGADE